VRAFATATFSIIALLVPIAFTGYAALSVERQITFSTPSSIAAVKTFSVPKTLVLSLINKVKDESEGKLKIILQDILNTPISPELLPLDDKGNIVQDSQKSIGPYKLHDFFIYHFLRYGASVKKIYYLACLTFKDEYKKEEIKATLSIFIKRFFTQQFKRNCVPDGVKIGSVSLSPRYDLKLNSDLSYKGYLKEIEDL